MMFNILQHRSWVIYTSTFEDSPLVNYEDELTSNQLLISELPYHLGLLYPAHFRSVSHKLSLTLSDDHRCQLTS